MNQIRAYYEKCGLWLPRHSNFRQLKRQLPDGTTETVRDQIRTEDQLRRVLLPRNAERTPIRIWYGVSLWTDPVHVKGKFSRYGSANFLGGEIPFDVETGLENVEKLVGLLLDSPYGLDPQGVEVFFSGGITETPAQNNGRRWTVPHFHLLIRPSTLGQRQEPDPRKRLKQNIQLRQELLDHVLNHGVDIRREDRNCTLDPWRVIALPRTVHPRTGYVVTEIPLDKLEKFELEEAERVFTPEAPRSRETTPRQREQNKAFGHCFPPSLPTMKGCPKGDDNNLHYQANGQATPGGGVAAQPPQPILHFSNTVLGTKHCYIPVLIYVKTNPSTVVQRLQRLRGFPDWYLFHEDPCIYAVNLKAMEYRQLRRFYMKHRRLQELSELTRYRQILFPIDRWFDIVVSPDLDFYETGFASRGHLQLFKKLRLPLANYTRLCGNHSYRGYKGIQKDAIPTPMQDRCK